MKVGVAVVGGGISGLTVAFRLRRAGQDVVVLDAGERPGGVIRSERDQGFLFEAGPDGLLAEPPETARLIADLGLADEVVRATASSRRRQLYLDGRLRAVPNASLSLLSSDLLSRQGKWRLLREPWVPPRAANDAEDESVLAFGERRLGPEAARNLLGPAAVGVFAGDAARLSLRSAFPRLHDLEVQHGGLLRGLRALRKQGDAPGRARPFSFRDGLERLPQALAQALAPRCHHARVTGLTPVPGGEGWHVERTPGPPLVADRVVLACGTRAAAALLRELAPAAGRALEGIDHAPVAAVCLGWRQRPAALDLEAYGFLVAPGQGLRLLGCQFSSSVFPGRAPEGGAAVRALMGGAFAPEVVGWSDARLTEVALDELRTVTRLDKTPDVVRVFRHPVGLPQYELGHETRVSEATGAVATLTRVHLLGYGLHGIGLNDCIREATALAKRLR